MEESEKIPERITFEYEGKPYTLEFDRASVTKAERTFGFNIGQLTNTVQLTLIHDLFSAAFLKNHARTPQSLINEIYNRMPRKTELYQQLVLMYVNVANSVLDTDDEDAEGNAMDWKAS